MLPLRTPAAAPSVAGAPLQPGRRGAGGLLAAAAGADGDKETNALIDAMLAAAPYELPNLVSNSLKAVSSPSFFMAIAARADAAGEDAAHVDRLAALASTVMSTLEVIVQRTEEKVDAGASLLQDILKAGAEDDGEFLVPLSNAKAAAMRAAVVAQGAALDEAFLSTVNAWVRKSEDSGLGGMVTMLQTVLQLYAAVALAGDAGASLDPSRDATDPASLLDRLLASRPEAWDAVLDHELTRSDAVSTKDALVSEVQRRIETTVLGATSMGSYAQRVQAEFLRELIQRINTRGKVSVVLE